MISNLGKIILASLLIASFSLAACSKGGGKCEKAIDKSVDMAMDMMKAFGAMAGDNPEAKKMMEAKMEEAKAEIKAKKPEMVEKCKVELKKNADLDKTLDCIIASKGMEDMQKCEGADFLKMK